jgi:putative transposase
MGRASYPTDLTDGEWHILRRLVPPLVTPSPKGHSYERREVLDAIFYIERAGCAWRLLPHDLPPWQIIYYWFSHWWATGRWEQIHESLYRRVRRASGRSPQPTACSIDSQSVRVTDTGQPSGYNPGKKIKGKKRHVAVDALGLVLTLSVTSADVQDWDEGERILAEVMMRYPRVKKVWADQIYRSLVHWAAENWGLDVEITGKLKGQRGFVPLPQRWKVERTFGWWNKNRRLSKDVERTVGHSEAFLLVASIRTMLHRLDAVGSDT